MILQLHQAKSAAFAFQKEMQIITNNVANAATIGHKEESVNMENIFPMVFERTISEFEDANVPAGQERKTYNQYGQGVRISEVVRNMRQGTIEVTNRSLDFAIQGRGFFQFRMPDGKLVYSRAGNLHQDNQGRIVSAAGHPIEPAIQIPIDATDVIINEEGRVFVQLNNQPLPQEVAQISLATFQNEEGLRSLGQNYYSETVSSGPTTLALPGQQAAGTVRQRALEFSNVNVVQQMMQMIITQRSFEVAVKAIKATDAILKSGADIKS